MLRHYAQLGGTQRTAALPASQAVEQDPPPAPAVNPLDLLGELLDEISQTNSLSSLAQGSPLTQPAPAQPFTPPSFAQLSGGQTASSSNGTNVFAGLIDGPDDN